MTSVRPQSSDLQTQPTFSQLTICFSSIYFIQFFHSLRLHSLDCNFNWTINLTHFKEEVNLIILCGDIIVYCNTSYVLFQPVTRLECQWYFYDCIVTTAALCVTRRIRNCPFSFRKHRQTCRANRHGGVYVKSFKVESGFFIKVIMELMDYTLFSSILSKAWHIFHFSR